MNQAVGRETQEWLVGHTRNHIIYIFSPSVFDKVSSHPASDFMPVLTHEIAHICTNSIFGNYKNQYPIWFREGIAGYIAGQYEKYNLKNLKTSKFTEITDSKDWNKKPNYPQAYLFTKYLIDKYGKDNVFDLLRLSSQEQSSLDFPEVFKKVTNNDFSEVANNWLKTVNS